jgi:hypothetical protein
MSTGEKLSLLINSESSRGLINSVAVASPEPYLVIREFFSYDYMVARRFATPRRFVSLGGLISVGSSHEALDTAPAQLALCCVYKVVGSMPSNYSCSSQVAKFTW